MLSRCLCLILALLALPVAAAPRVVTDIAPVQSLVAQVMQGVGEPVNILRPGASPHHHALRPSEAAALDTADVIFRVGGGLTPWLDRVLENLAGDARVITLIDVPGTIRHPAREMALFALQAPLQGADEGHDHDHGGLDPHAWLDPENGKIWLDAIARALGERDPENAALYLQNAAAGKAGIDATMRTVAAILAPLESARFIVYHDAYQYFERRFGLSVVGAISVADARPPGPARLARLRDRLGGMKIDCVLAPPQSDPRVIAAVLDGGAARIAVLDPLGAGLARGPDFYTTLLTGMAEAIARCR